MTSESEFYSGITLRLFVQFPPLNDEVTRAVLIERTRDLHTFERPEKKHRYSWGNEPIDVKIPSSSYGFKVRLFKGGEKEWLKSEVFQLNLLLENVGKGILMSRKLEPPLEERSRYRQPKPKDTEILKINILPLEILEPLHAPEHPFPPFEDLELTNQFDTLNRVEAVVELFEGFKADMNDQQCWLATILLSSFRRSLAYHLPERWKELSKYASTSRSDPVYDLLAELKSMRNSASEDLLVQLHAQMEYIASCRSSIPDSLIQQFIQVLVKCLYVLFALGDGYSSKGYKILRSLNLTLFPIIADIRSRQLMLIKFRAHIAVHLGHLEETPPDDDDAAFKMCIYKGAFEEVVQRLETGPYQELLYMFKGFEAQWAFERMRDDLELWTKEPGLGRKCSAVRQMMVRLMQMSRYLPHQLWKYKFELVTSTHDGGSFGLIKQCIRLFGRGYNPEVALKELIKGVDEHVLFRELLIQANLHHPHVLRVIGVVQPDWANSRVSMVTPWLENGNISNYLKKNNMSPERKYSLIDKWIMQLAKGIEYLHSECIIHGDIRNPNIFVTSDLSVVIADFGLASFEGGLEILHLDKYPRNESTPPELYLEDATKRRYTYEADVFAFGICCIDMYTEDDLERDDVGGIIDLDQGDMTDELWSIVQKCVDPIKERRPNITQVVQELESIAGITYQPITQTKQELLYERTDLICDPERWFPQPPKPEPEPERRR